MSRKFIAILTASVASLSISGHSNAQSNVVNGSGNRAVGVDWGTSVGMGGVVKRDVELGDVVVGFLKSGAMLEEIGRDNPQITGMHTLKIPNDAWVRFKGGDDLLTSDQILAMVQWEPSISKQYERLKYESGRDVRLQRNLEGIISLEMSPSGRGREFIYFYTKNPDAGVFKGSVNVIKLSKRARLTEIANLRALDRDSSVYRFDFGGNRRRELVQPENVKVEIGSAKSEDGVRTRESEITRDGMVKGVSLEGVPTTPPFKRRGDAPVGMEKGQASPTSTTTRLGTNQRSSPRAISAVTLGRSDSTTTSSERKRKK